MRWSPPEQNAQPPSFGRRAVAGEEHAADVGGLPGVVEHPVELVDRRGAEGVAHLGAVEGDPHRAVGLGPVVGDVRRGRSRAPRPRRRRRRARRPWGEGTGPDGRGTRKGPCKPSSSTRASPGTRPRQGGPSRPTSPLSGLPTQAFPITQIDYQALSDADLVIVGSWVDGLVVVGQRPGRLGRIKGMPALSGKRAIVYLTYAIDPGHALPEDVGCRRGPRGRGARGPAHPAGQARGRRGRLRGRVLDVTASA